jgi:SMODS and SLOG-associating 2TM effector domain 3/SMODS and SLOG-associating 2TM effector domain 1
VTTTPAILSDDLPVLYRGASQQSGNAQRSFLRWFELRLYAIVVAAFGGAIAWKVGHVYIGGVIAFLAFAVALGSELVLAIRRPDEIWYEARAAAESAKTLSWRYMMRGESFETKVENPETTLLAELREVLSDLDALPVRAKSGSDVQITPTMRQVRALPFQERRALYLRERIQAQQGWYADEAARNQTRANRWITASITLEFLGLVGAAVKAAGWTEIDLLGILATAAAGATGWMQAKQYQSLAADYGIASQELATVATELEAVKDETVWARFVTEAEGAISREQTLWRASHGVRFKSPRRDI